jgi:hypothetical protein
MSAGKSHLIRIRSEHELKNWINMDPAMDWKSAALWKAFS